jgi:hypothetical protein
MFRNEFKCNLNGFVLNRHKPFIVQVDYLTACCKSLISCRKFHKISCNKRILSGTVELIYRCCTEVTVCEHLYVNRLVNLRTLR